MSDTLIAVIATAATGFCAGFAKLIMWIVRQWREERAVDRADRKEERAIDRAALLENTRAMTVLGTRVEQLDQKLTTMAEDFEDVVTGVHDKPPPKKRARTAPLGVTTYSGRPPRQDDH